MGRKPPRLPMNGNTETATVGEQIKNLDDLDRVYVTLDNGQEIDARVAYPYAGDTVRVAISDDMFDLWPGEDGEARVTNPHANGETVGTIESLDVQEAW
ncbi:hypothetical protein ACFR9U_16150 [Halorientalis brevis]|uniref:Uncharacterized protein n=1 Tax=Halorientalis brevis TaxID=1126241 RepID=A0ABD6CFP6_9EURY|nr:hypothetical protein [Halorientalis brevis]